MPPQQEESSEQQFRLQRLLPHRLAVRGRWRYASLDGLLMAHGRWFTPSPLPAEVAPGVPGACFRESLAWASEQPPNDTAYVEGFADDMILGRTAHAWCSRADARAIDRTWNPPGVAYTGLPLLPEAAKSFMHDNGTRSVLFASGGLISPTAENWMRHGIPQGVLADVGIPFPAAFPQPG
ncbi:hypothetical protein [Streptomyces uncialis]|uniref:hypothetical protein n=1 Tax=Streptomyces uncialis TaxID=1048205 RepID=UPI0034062F19